MYTDSLGNQLEIGDVILASLDHNSTPVLAVVTAFRDQGTPSPYQYITIKYITGTRHWKSKASGRFPHPDVRWKPNRKPGEYVFGVTSKEENILGTRFIVKVTNPLDLAEFCRRHMSWYFSQFDQAHKTLQTQQDFIDMINTELVNLKNNGRQQE